MFTISEVFGKVSDSDSLSRWIPYSSFLAPDVFVTKTGALGMTVAMDGIDYETKTQAQLESVSRQLLAANRVIGPKNRVYHHMIKRPGAKVQRRDLYENPTVDRLVSRRADHLENKTGLFEIRLYTTILLEGVVGGKSAPTLSEQTAGAVLDATLRDAIGQLRETVYAYTSHVGSFLGVTVLDKYGIFEHLSALLNPDFDSVQNSNLLYDEELNYFSGHTSIIRNRTTLTWGDSKAQVFVLREEPMTTTAHMFRDLMLAPSGVIVCCEWKLTDKIATMQMLRSKRRRVNSQTRSAVQTAIDGDKSTNMVDAGASENTEVLNQALRAMTNDQAYFTHFSMTVVVFDEREETLRQAAGKVKTVFAQYDAQIIKEDYHARRTFLAMLPGNSPLNIRYRLLINTAVADLAPVYRSSTGHTQNTYLGDEYMTVLQTTEGTPFHLNLHHGQVGSTLIIGATGSGKSFLLDQLIDDSQKYDPYTILIDVGGSHRLVTKRHGGVYVQVDLNSRGFQMNPFMRLPYNPNSVNLIRELLNRLFLVDGYTPTAEEDKVLTDEINAVYCLSESRRKLSRLAISPKLRTKMHLWIEDGMFAHFFDGDRDDLSLTKFSTFDFTGLEDVPKLLGPLMFYMSSWVSNIVRDPANGPIPKGIWMDEGWRFGSLHDFILSSAKTFRKHRAWIVFATQDEEDLRTNDLLTVLNTSCHTKIFLSNPGADDAIYGTTFRLNERERALLQSMQIGEGLVKTPVSSHHIQYSVPPERLKEYHSQFFHAAL